jgi:hypothetical protein
MGDEAKERTGQLCVTVRDLTGPVTSSTVTVSGAVGKCRHPVRAENLPRRRGVPIFLLSSPATITDQKMKRRGPEVSRAETSGPSFLGTVARGGRSTGEPESGTPSRTPRRREGLPGERPERTGPGCPSTGTVTGPRSRTGTRNPAQFCGIIRAPASRQFPTFASYRAASFHQKNGPNWFVY